MPDISPVLSKLYGKWTYYYYSKKLLIQMCELKYSPVQFQNKTITRNFFIIKKLICRVNLQSTVCSFGDRKSIWNSIRPNGCVRVTLHTNGQQVFTDGWSRQQPCRVLIQCIERWISKTQNNYRQKVDSSWFWILKRSLCYVVKFNVILSKQKTLPWERRHGQFWDMAQ